MTASRLLRFSGFHKLSESGDRLNGNVMTLHDGVDIREHIIGGVGYPLLPWLITPYECDNLSVDMMNFNKLHEAARVIAMRHFHS